MRDLTQRCTTQSDTRSGSAGLLMTMCLAVLLVQVDTSVVNLATRAIGEALHAGVMGLQWVLDAYNIAYAALLLTGGLLADLYGRRRLFLCGTAVFTGGSMLCAAAPNVAVLIAARAVAGAGAALLLPASLSIIRVAWSDERTRNRALGVWGACNGLAFVVGPTAGGALVDSFGWRSVFLIAIPLGLAAFGCALRVVTESRDPAGRQFDALGQIWGAVTLVAVALAGIEAGRDRTTSVVAMVAAIASLLLLLFTEQRRGSSALLPLDLFSRRRFVGVLAATATMTFGMYGVLFLVPLAWQASGALPAGGAGLALLPMAVVFFALSNYSGRLTERVGARAMIAGGTALIGLGLYVIALTTAGMPISAAETGLVLTGLGMGLNTGPLFGVAVAAVPAARSGNAASLINVARMIGATLGVAILGSAFALAGSGASGLRIAMALGGTVQLIGAGVAWLALRDEQSRSVSAGSAVSRR
jgi:MFS transporter, DHA2 family, methylenomycin A resistance protein